MDGSVEAWEIWIIHNGSPGSWTHAPESLREGHITPAHWIKPDIPARRAGCPVGQLAGRL